MLTGYKCSYFHSLGKFLKVSVSCMRDKRYHVTRCEWWGLNKAVVYTAGTLLKFTFAPYVISSSTTIIPWWILTYLKRTCTFIHCCTNVQWKIFTTSQAVHTVTPFILTRIRVLCSRGLKTNHPCTSLIPPSDFSAVVWILHPPKKWV